MGDTDRIERDLYAMEKELRSIKTKLDNSIIDIRAVDYWNWIPTEDGSRKWDVIRHEIQYKRQGFSEWISIPVVQRDLNDYTQLTLPNGELDE